MAGIIGGYIIRPPQDDHDDTDVNTLRGARNRPKLVALPQYFLLWSFDDDATSRRHKDNRSKTLYALCQATRVSEISPTCESHEYQSNQWTSSRKAPNLEAGFVSWTLSGYFGFAEPQHVNNESFSPSPQMINRVSPAGWEWIQHKIANGRTVLQHVGVGLHHGLGSSVNLVRFMRVPQGVCKTLLLGRKPLITPRLYATYLGLDVEPLALPAVAIAQPMVGVRNAAARAEPMVEAEPVAAVFEADPMVGDDDVAAEINIVEEVLNLDLPDSDDEGAVVGVGADADGGGNAGHIYLCES